SSSCRPSSGSSSVRGRAASPARPCPVAACIQPRIPTATQMAPRCNRLDSRSSPTAATIGPPRAAIYYSGQGAVDGAVSAGRGGPVVAAGHGVPPHRLQSRLRAEGVERAADGAGKRAEAELAEQEAGAAVLDGVGEAAGAVRDRQRAAALGV